ncbi:MAG: hypothetical protein HY903_06445 [Deltaproteobacteria bacterium]|nr:hypothetical protein [Deltaproteobacteria bacterium]
MSRARYLGLAALWIAACDTPLFQELPTVMKVEGALCGNGQLQLGEACDDANTDNGDGCSAACGVEAGWRCDGAPSLCDEVCGDQIKAGAEACDDGDSISNGEGRCVADCSAVQTCGDGATNGTEGCDDGDTIDNGDGGCLANCQALQICGDGNVRGTEYCDDGDTLSNGDGRCVADCTAIQYCGDSAVSGTEGCDDGNRISEGEGGCLADCSAIQVCGDGTLQGLEACDDGDALDDGEGQCLGDCSGLQRCGDQVTAGTEACDDGDQIDNGEGRCVADCSGLQRCGDGLVSGGEGCDDGDAHSLGEGTCLGDCSAVQVCGDGVVNGTEACDDGDTQGGGNGNCSAACDVIQFCGDGKVDGDEVCDDGNYTAGDYCRPDCAAVTGRCGDDILQSNEACDDGDALTNGEGACVGDCSAIQVCGDGVREGSEACDNGRQCEDGSGNLYACVQDGDCLAGLCATRDGDGCTAACQIEAGFDCGVLGTVCVGVLYVDAAATGNSDGSSWTHAFTDLQSALNLISGRSVEIWVAGGTYGGNLSFGNFALPVSVYGGFAGGETARSLRDVAANPTIVTGGRHGMAVGNNLLLDGFVVRGGRDDPNQGVYPPPPPPNEWDPPNEPGYGGGVWIRSGSPTFANCRFEGNYADEGGAVDAGSGSPYFVNCVFAGNEGVLGGAVIVRGGNPVFVNCTFVDNTARDGGGIYVQGGSPIIVNDTFAFNNVRDFGEAVFVDAGAPVILNTIASGYAGRPIQGVLVNNSRNINGPDPLWVDADGADDLLGTPDDDFHLSPASPAVDRGDFSRLPDDRADIDHDGDTSEPVPLDGAQTGRWSDHPGAANAGVGAVPVLDLGAFESYAPGCGNYYVEAGETCDDGNTTAGDYCAADCQTVIGFCGDRRVQARETCDTGHDSPGCDVDCTAPSCGDGHINHAAGESCDDGGTLAGDGCAAACTHEAGATCVGAPSVCDLHLYVNAAAAPGGDGGSWARALSRLPDALAIAGSATIPVTVWVAAGTYRPDQGSAETPNSRASSFRLPRGLELYGGFAGSETDLAARDLAAHETVLSGTLDTVAAYHVVDVGGPGTSPGPRPVVLDGFSIRGGSADGDENAGDDTGGGLRCQDVALIVGHTIFEGNRAIRGGGIGSGGQVGYWGGCDLVVHHSRFYANAADQAGGAIGVRGGQMTAEQSVFVGNSAPAGSAIYADSFTLWNLTLAANGGYLLGGDGEFHNLVLSANGPGPMQGSWSIPTFSCSDQAYQSWGGNPVFQYAEDLVTDPELRRLPTDGGDGWQTLGNNDYGDLRLRGTSPCIDAGYSWDIGLATTDVDGGPRRIAHPIAPDRGAGGLPVVDMGAYEMSSVCGDFAVDPGLSEVCDDGNRTPLDYCSADCDVITGSCGDTTVQANEVCDTGAQSASCDADCTDVICGDGFVNGDASEACDDGDIAAADGCSPGCTVEVGWVCRGQPSSCVYIIHVDASALGGGDGASWATAFNKLQDALADAAARVGVQEIWVAGGTYVPDEGALQADDDITSTFRLQSGVALYGGFAGTETSRAARNLGAQTTVLSGLLEPTGPVHARQVVTAYGVDSSAVLDGFVIRDGRGGCCGSGAMYVNGSPTVRHCQFRDNVGQGSGVVLVEGGDPSFANCLFVNNSGPGEGHAMTLFGTGTVRVTSCTFADNDTSNEPSIIKIFSGSLELTNSVLWGGGSGNEGVVDWGAMSLVLDYNVIEGGFWGTNVASDPLFVGGGDYHLQAASPAVDAGSNLLLPLDVDDQDGDGDLLEPCPFDLAGAARQVDAARADTGVGPAPIVDMGAFEAP